MMKYSRGWEPRLTSNIDGEEHYEEDGGLSCSQHVERLEWEWKSSSWWARHIVLSSGRHSLWLGWQSRLVMCYISAVVPPGGELCKSVQSVHLSAALRPQPRPRQHWISTMTCISFFQKGKNFYLYNVFLMISCWISRRIIQIYTHVSNFWQLWLYSPIPKYNTIISEFYHLLIQTFKAFFECWIGV